MTRDSDNADDGAHSLRERLHSPPVKLAVVLTVLSILLLSTAMLVAANAVVVDDFEDGDTDEWTVVRYGDAQGHFDAQAFDVFEGTYAGELAHTGGSDQIAAYRTVPSNTSSLSARLNFTDGGNAFHMAVMNDSPGGEFDSTPYIATVEVIPSLSSGAVRLCNEDSCGPGDPVIVDNLNSSQQDQWLKLQFEMDYANNETTAILLNENGTELGRNTTAIPSRHDTITDVNQTLIKTNGGKWYIDYVVQNGSAIGVTDPQTDTDEDLRLNVPKHLEHNESGYYEVLYNDSGTWTDVTNDSNTSITLSNPDAATFYPSNHTVVATNNSSINEAVTVTADYGTLTDQEDMVVAGTTIENLAILPDPWIKTEASVGDGMMLWLIGAALVAIVGARAAGPTAGAGAYVMVMAAGWISTPVSNGVMIVAMTAAIFLGLNVALNIDTSVRQ